MVGYTNIPTALCEFALVNRKINQLKLYVYLKMSCDGEIENGKDFYRLWAKDLNISTKTIKNSLEWLIKNDWIYVNSKKETLRIISYKKLRDKLGINFRSGYFYEPTDFKDFQAMCCGVTLVSRLGGKKYSDRQSVKTKGFAKVKNCKKNMGFYPMANAFFAKCLQVSTSTACRIKQLAEAFGYIDTKSNVVNILDSNGNPVGVDNYSAYVEFWKETGYVGRFRKGRKYLKIVDADLIKSNITLKKKNFKW